MKTAVLKISKLLAVLAILAGTGICLNFAFAGDLWLRLRSRMPETSAASLADTAGTGMALGTLGGFRTVLADIAWLRAYSFWEKSSLNDCEALCALARTMDPQNFFFWENSINYVAYDFPNWVIRERGGWRQVSEAVQAEIHRRAYARGLELVGEWSQRFPESGHVWTYAAQMCIVKTAVIYGRSDFESALQFYERAMLCEKAPWFAFLAYANITRMQLPERRERSRDFLRERLSAAGTPERLAVIEDALEILSAE
ncbi:MAG: hypothetical protein K6B46_00340 [Opitutales bacterium]|nr:hypothetical protein [Opitutales bacterium]